MENDQSRSTALILPRLTPAEAEGITLGIQVEDWLKKGEEAVEASGSLVVRDDDSNGKAIDFTGQVKRTAKQVEEARQSYKAPILVIGRRIDSLFAPILDNLKSAEKAVKDKIATYADQKLREQEKERLRLQREYDARLAREEKRAEKKGTEPAYVPPPAPVEVPTTARGDSASAVMKRPWRYEILEDAKVPREFCSPDTKKIKAGVDSGLRTIAGCRIFQATEVSIK